MDFAADIMALIRSGGPLSAHDVARAQVNPDVRAVRELVKATDFGHLQSLCDSADPATMHLGFTLLDQIATLPEVHEYIVTKWNTGDLPFDAQVAAAHKLLDYPGVAASVSQSLYDFVLGNWNDYCRMVARWYGGADRVLPLVRERLTQAGRYPLTKRWIYICDVAASSDKVGSKELIAKFREVEGDLFLAAVARTVYDRV